MFLPLLVFWYGIFPLTFIAPPVDHSVIDAFLIIGEHRIDNETRSGSFFFLIANIFSIFNLISCCSCSNNNRNQEALTQMAPMLSSWYSHWCCLLSSQCYTITTVLIINPKHQQINRGTMHCGWSMRSTMWHLWHMAWRSGETTTCRCSMVCANLWPLALTFILRCEQCNNKTQYRHQFVWTYWMWFFGVLLYRAIQCWSRLIFPIWFPLVVVSSSGYCALHHDVLFDLFAQSSNVTFALNRTIICLWK